jgi:hypothetical protein
VLVPALNKFGPGGSESVILLDNNSLNHELTAFNCLDRVTNGKWHFTYAYGHDDIAIEKGFGNVKNWLKDYTAETYRDPVDLLECAFTYYSSHGPGAASAHGHWNSYFSNYRNRNR